MRFLLPILLILNYSENQTNQLAELSTDLIDDFCDFTIAELCWPPLMPTIRMSQWPTTKALGTVDMPTVSVA